MIGTKFQWDLNQHAKIFQLGNINKKCRLWHGLILYRTNILRIMKLWLNNCFSDFKHFLQKFTEMCWKIVNHFMSLMWLSTVVRIVVRIVLNPISSNHSGRFKYGFQLYFVIFRSSNVQYYGIGHAVYQAISWSNHLTNFIAPLENVL